MPQKTIKLSILQKFSKKNFILSFIPYNCREVAREMRALFNLPPPSLSTPCLYFPTTLLYNMKLSMKCSYVLWS